MFDELFDVLGCCSTPFDVVRRRSTPFDAVGRSTLFDAVRHLQLYERAYLEGNKAGKGLKQAL